MKGTHKLVVDLPTVMDQETFEVGSNKGCGFLEAPPGQNPVTRSLGRDGDPQPPQGRRRSPAALIHRNAEAGTHVLLESFIGRLTACAHARDGLTQSTRRHPQLKRPFQDLCRLAEGNSNPFVQHRRQRQGLRSQLRGRCAQSVRGLALVAALNPGSAIHAGPDMDPEPDHPGLSDNLTLVLLLNALVVDLPATPGAGIGKKGIQLLIHLQRYCPMGLASIFGSPLTTLLPGIPLGLSLGERSGLALRCSSSKVELPSQPIPFTPELVPFVPKILD